MNLYRVVLKEVRTYNLEIEADSQDTAEDLAYEHPDYMRGDGDDLETEVYETELIEEDIWNDEEGELEE